MHAVKTMMELIKKIYPLRTCKYNLSPENIQKHKFKVCLEYHIGNCKGPCEGYQSSENYQDNIQQIRDILKGNMQRCIHFLEQKMFEFSKERNYEQAQLFKDNIKTLKNFVNKSKVVNPKIHHVDVFSIENEEKTAYVNYLKIVNGAIVQIHTIQLKKKMEEETQDLLANAILEIRERMKSQSKEIILENSEDIHLKDVKLTVPKTGDKKKLLELSKRNLTFYKAQTKKIAAQKTNKDRYQQRVETLKNDLSMNERPDHVECFDISNTSGTSPVASCVVFKHGKPSKQDYRKFHIKTVEGMNDFASMQEVVYRRYNRLMKENLPLPNLIVIDGGKGQLNAAISSLKELGLKGSIKIIGIAKRLEEIYQENDPYPLHLDKRSISLKFIQHLRDEAHRFGVTFHRKVRTKKGINTELEEIQGIGQRSIQQLLTHFKSVEEIKNAKFEKISKIVGKDKATKIVNYFSSEQ
jgi:excinuclease ABC subunit C